MNTAELRADADLDACRAAFPALDWYWHTAYQYRGALPPAHVVSVGVEPHGADGRRWCIARLFVGGAQVRQLTDDSVSAALAALRQAMTAVRDDLTAALGGP